MRQAEHSNKVVVETRNKYTQPQIFNYIGWIGFWNSYRHYFHSFAYA